VRPGINHRRNADDKDDDEDDQENRPNGPRTPGDWISGQPSNTQLEAPPYMTEDWAGWEEGGTFNAEQPKQSSREKVEAYLDHQMQVASSANETSLKNRHPAEKGHRLVITLSNGKISLGEISPDFRISSSRVEETLILSQGIPPLRAFFAFRSPGDNRKSQIAIATAVAHQDKQMFDSTESFDLRKQNRENPQSFPLIYDVCKEEQCFDRKDLWARHANECHGILGGWICGIDGCGHMCYGESGLLAYLLRQHKLRELMQKGVVTIRESLSLSNRFQSESNLKFSKASGQLDVLRQYLLDRYHYAMEKKVLRVESNGTLATSWDQRNLFHFGSPERLLDLLMSKISSQRCENTMQLFRDPLKVAFSLDRLDFYFGPKWRAWASEIITLMSLQEIEKDPIVSIIWKDNGSGDATTTLNPTATKCNLCHKQLVDTAMKNLLSSLSHLDHPATKETTIAKKISSSIDDDTAVDQEEQMPHCQHTTTQPLLWLAVMKEHEALVKLLLEGGANLNSSDKYFRTPLFYAAKNGCEAVARLLLEKGANPHFEDIYLRTPLFYAAKNGYEAVARLLLEEGADPDSWDIYLRTPLFYAAKNGYEAVARLPLEKGANPHFEDIYSLC
jgi:hypothetical protein